MNLVLVAEEAAGQRALRLVAERRLPVAGVLTKTDAVAALARELALETLDPKLVEDPAFATWVRGRGVDLLLNVHSVLNPHPEVLAAPRIGSFNMHPGPLPRYAGFNAPSWAIAEGEGSHAVTVHRMVPEMDAGPIAYERRFEIRPRDTGLRVATRGVQEGIPLLGRLLDDAERDAVPSRPQIKDGWRFFWYEVPHDGWLPWEAGARRVVDLVRAADYAPYPSPWGTFRTLVDGEKVEIVRAVASGEAADAPAGTVGEARDGAALVSAGDEWVSVQRARRGGEEIAPPEAFPSGASCVSPAPGLP